MVDSTHPLHFQSADGKFGLSVPEDVVKELLKYCQDAEDVETGGIIIGRYSDDQVTAVVDRVTGPPPDSKHLFTRFLRGVQGLQALLNRVWSKPERQYYLGEWHYHPRPNPAPSAEDIGQMQEIAKSERYACPEPVLLIVYGQPSDRRGFSAHVFKRADSSKSMLFSLPTE